MDARAQLMLGKFESARFFQDYWQKRHLFLPQSLANFRSPLSPQDLMRLCKHAEVESRLVDNSSEEAPWQLREGPFVDADFSALGDKNWTLLVQDVDKFVPEVARFIDLLSDFPRWSIDDIMVSYAVAGGSVGPHTDKYDVFLVQAQGHRRWGIAESVDEEDVREDTSLRVLRSFLPELTYEAHPGDVLYVPPGVAHYGVAMDDCLTYSFGFRAPTEAAIVSAFADELVAQARMYTLRENLEARSSGTAELSSALKAQVQAMLDGAQAAMGPNNGWLGRYLSEPKQNIVADSPEKALEASVLFTELKKGRVLCRDRKSRFLFSDDQGSGDTGTVWVFVDGEQFELTGIPRARELAIVVCEAETIDLSSMNEWLAPRYGPVVHEMLATLHNSGSLKFIDP